MDDEDLQTNNNNNNNHFTTNNGLFTSSLPPAAAHLSSYATLSCYKYGTTTAMIQQWWCKLSRLEIVVNTRMKERERVAYSKYALLLFGRQRYIDTRSSTHHTCPKKITTASSLSSKMKH
jgi:hypothetical protein